MTTDSLSLAIKILELENKMLQDENARVLAKAQEMNDGMIATGILFLLAMASWIIYFIIKIKRTQL